MFGAFPNEKKIDLFAQLRLWIYEPKKATPKRTDAIFSALDYYGAVTTNQFLLAKETLQLNMTNKKTTSKTIPMYS